MKLVNFVSTGKDPTVFAFQSIWDNPDLFDGKFSDKEYAINVYNDWIHEAKRYVPADQLLIFNVKQGWEPLCNFLNKSIPDEYKDKGFPRTNSSKEIMNNHLKSMKRINKFANYAVTALIVVSSTFGVRYLYKRYYNNNE